MFSSNNYRKFMEIPTASMLYLKNGKPWQPLGPLLKVKLLEGHM